MSSLRQMLRRDDSEFVDADDPAAGPLPMANFFVTLLGFFMVGSCIALFLLFLRRRRRMSRQAVLPTHREPSHHRNLTITTSANLPPSIHVYEEKQKLMADSSSPPASPVPEIRITFPEEEGSTEKDKAPRVVVVRIGDTGAVGMEPLPLENLPPYQSSDADRFQSLDLERLGGLREKEQAHQRWS